MTSRQTMIVAEMLENNVVAENCHKLMFKTSIDVLPGQFIMIWIPGIDEIPMSISHIRNDLLGMTVKIIGDATKSLCSLKPGDRVRMRGPYGRPFEIKGSKPLLVAGGIGIAPLHLLASYLSERQVRIKVIIGSKTKSELALVSDFESLGIEPLLATDDGSIGFTGTASDCLRQMIEKSPDVDSIYCCGPEPMIKAIADIATARNILGQAALERLMKCGIGICGSCAINDKLVCRDGPVFDFSELKRLAEFGKSRRDASGSLRDIL